uniref:Phospholipase B1, membrane-associated n=1 Tax=Acrobeloides nanus TaxID=290746 RepID=A0A914DQB7_9BILA
MFFPHHITKRSSTLAILAIFSLNHALPDLGVNNYSCDATLMAPSKTKPTNVNSLRPADINLVMALGDSLTAANGAGATDAIQILLQYRGLAFLAGGDKGLEEHITVPNILRKYNPNLYGQSYGIGSSDVWDVAYLNMGFPGAESGDLVGQANQLVSLLKMHSDEIDVQNDWKLLNIFIGGNDLCAWCHDPNGYTADDFVTKITAAIQIIKNSVPRVLVNLITMFQFEMVRGVDQGQGFCQALHVSECDCEMDKNFTNPEMKNVSISYQLAEKKLEQSGLFDSDDFTLVTQPFFNDVTTPPQLANGSVNLAFFAPDCFHFSQLGHAVVSSWAWKNMLEPVGNKTTQANFNNGAPLSCPDPTCPFIRTVKNSQNCAQFVTPAAW